MGVAANTKMEGVALIEIEHCWIPMRDGVRLSARIWRPADERNHPVFARAGYACLRVDMRGSGDSEGVMHDMYTTAEQDDAIDVIEWIAAQEWCEGSVGMMGTSWGGTASLQAAGRRPPQLKAVIAVCATDDRFEDDIHMMGGRVNSDTVEWGATLPAILALPPDPNTVGPGWRDIWRNRLNQVAFPLSHWISHRAKDAYWRNGSVSDTPGAIACPTLAVGGWVDRYSSSVMDLVADNPQMVWGVVGPWGHHYPDHGQPGPAMDFQRFALAWWDRWLRGLDNGADAAPRLRVWVRGYDAPKAFQSESAGRWVAVADHGSRKERQFGLDSRGALSGVGGQGAAQIPYSLLSGLAAGDTGYFGRIGGLPIDQEVDDAEALTFETAPLTEPLEMLGAATINFRVNKAATVGMIAARLVDIGPGGAARVAFAVRDLTLDDALAEPRDPDAPITLRFPNTAYRFGAGHRLRLSLSATYWPMTAPTSSTTPIDLDLEGAHLTIQLISNEVAATAPPAAPPSPARMEDGPERETIATESDVIVRWRQHPRRSVLADIGVAFSVETIAEHQIKKDDPLSATTSVEHRISLERADGDFVVVGTARLRRVEAGLEADGALVVKENGVEVFQREWVHFAPTN